MKANKDFVFDGKEYREGDEIDLETLETEDRARLLMLGVFDEPKPAKKPKAEK